MGGVAMANPGEVAGELAAKKEERSDVPGDRDDGKTKRQEGTERYGGEEKEGTGWCSTGAAATEAGRLAKAC